MEKPIETLTVAVNADTRSFEEQLTGAATLGRQFGRTLSSAFEGVALSGKGLSETIRGVAQSLSRIAFNAAFKPLEQGIGQAFASMLTGSVMPFARGAAFSQGMPVPFAAGGVIAAPMTFPMANGRIGLAGEQGPEAIMPLARGPDGRLGVRAAGSLGMPSIIFNVTATDAESFKRSETQIAALLARAVQSGQRNL